MFTDNLLNCGQGKMHAEILSIIMSFPYESN